MEGGREGGREKGWMEGGREGGKRVEEGIVVKLRIGARGRRGERERSEEDVR